MNEYRALSILAKKLKKHKDEVKDKQNKNYYVGAITLDKKNNPLAVGFNSYTKTHPYQKELAEKVAIEEKKEQAYLHAEISALLKSAGKAQSIIVARIGNDESEYKLAKPCPVCQEAIKQAGIETVFYTNNGLDLVLLNWGKE